MNGDMISREAAKKTVRFECGEWAGLAKTIIKGLDALPATQPQRMNGRWIPDNLVGGGYWVCTVCKHPSEAFAANVLYKYCPYCGAKMTEQDSKGD